MEQEDYYKMLGNYYNIEQEQIDLNHFSLNAQFGLLFKDKCRHMHLIQGGHTEPISTISS